MWTEEETEAPPTPVGFTLDDWEIAFKPEIAPWKEWLFILVVGAGLGTLGWILGSAILASR